MGWFFFRVGGKGEKNDSLSHRHLGPNFLPFKPSRPNKTSRALLATTNACEGVKSSVGLSRDKFTAWMSNVPVVFGASVDSRVVVGQKVVVPVFKSSITSQYFQTLTSQWPWFRGGVVQGLEQLCFLLVNGWVPVVGWHHRTWKLLCYLDMIAGDGPPGPNPIKLATCNKCNSLN